MKKKLKLIIPSIILVILIAGGSVTYSFLPHPLNYNIKGIEKIGSRIETVSKTEDTVTIKKDGNDVFKILMFTDMHLDGKNKTSEITVDNLVKNITSEKPDLVILGGDNVTSAFNKKRAHQLARIFEKLGVYWAGILGNHEGDNSYSVSREEMMDIFTSYEHCLMLKGKEDIWGVCNYSLDILNGDGSLKQSLYFLDTGDEADDAEIEKYGVEITGKTLYDGVKEDQVAWYKAKLNETTEKYGNTNSVMILHIPPYQMSAAAETQQYLYGAKNEGVGSSCFDSGIFEAVKNGGSTKAIFFGHDHVNNFAVELDGILLSYIEPSGYGSYNMYSKFDADEKDWLQGYTKIEIATNGSFTNEFRRNSENIK